MTNIIDKSELFSNIREFNAKYSPEPVKENIYEIDSGIKIEDCIFDSKIKLEAIQVILESSVSKKYKLKEIHKIMNLR